MGIGSVGCGLCEVGVLRSVEGPCLLGDIAFRVFWISSKVRSVTRKSSFVSRKIKFVTQKSYFVSWKIQFVTQKSPFVSSKIQLVI